jgi:hypothetical protein
MSPSPCNERFDIAQTEKERRAYRDMIITTPDLADSISGVILCDETIRQHLTSGEPFAAALVASGMVPGIKVDFGAHPLVGRPGEKVIDGLDGLRERLRYVGLAHGSRSGGPFSPSARPRRAAAASGPTPTPWPATRRCVRKPVWFPSWNPKS